MRKASEGGGGEEGGSFSCSDISGEAILEEVRTSLESNRITATTTVYLSSLRGKQVLCQLHILVRTYVRYSCPKLVELWGEKRLFISQLCQVVERLLSSRAFAHAVTSYSSSVNCKFACPCHQGGEGERQERILVVDSGLFNISFDVGRMEAATGEIFSFPSSSSDVRMPRSTVDLRYGKLHYGNLCYTTSKFSFSFEPVPPS